MTADDPATKRPGGMPTPRDAASLAHVERLITETGIRLPAFRLVKAGETVGAYTTDLSWRPLPFAGVADVPRVLEEFEHGATIVLQWTPPGQASSVIPAANLVP